MAGNFFDFQNQIRPRRASGSAAAPAGRDAPLSVSQITRQISQILSTQLPASVTVRGEVTNYRARAASGHLYFALKDASAALECVVYRSDVIRLATLPDNGVEVVAEGNIGVYQAAGRYQLVVRQLELVGKGALDVAFRKLCAKLEAEGLFSAERKRPLPAYPRRLVIITSLHAAGLADILKVFSRYPWLQLSIYHVPVQGEGSGQQIAAALVHVDETIGSAGAADAVIIARGGGSAQDLWAFNDESLARAIVASRLPVITGIGHEIDVSVADLVADYHAHTPTAAAEALVATWKSAQQLVMRGTIQLNRALLRSVAQARRALLEIERHPYFRRPTERINQERQRLDDRIAALHRGVTLRLTFQRAAVRALDRRLQLLEPAILLRQASLQTERLDRRAALATRALVSRLQTQFSQFNTRLVLQSPRLQLARSQSQLLRMMASLDRAFHEHLKTLRSRVEATHQRLELLNPKAILNRGYSITLRRRDGAIVRAQQQVSPGDRIVTLLADGQVESIVRDQAQGELFNQ